MTDAMDPLARLQAESTRFQEVLAGVDPAARVPSCPDWTAADLLWHLGTVQSFWARIVADRLADPAPVEEPARPSSYDELLAFFDAATGRLTDALRSTADDVAVWTWFDADRSVGFVRRRQVHEALIHRVDAELTAGVASELDAALATDGALEVLEVMFSEPPTWADVSWAGPVGVVRTTDTGAEWWVQVGTWSGRGPQSGTDYTDEPALRLLEQAGTAAFTVGAAAADLDRWLWNRPADGEVRVDGDAATFLAVVHEGLQ